MNYNNLAQRTNFIAGSPQFSNLPFFLTNVNIPGITLTHTEVGGRSGAKMHITADTLIFNTLSLEMLVDEDFLIYQELMDTISANIDIENGTFSDFVFDFFIEISNSKGNKVMKVDFSNCRIESLGDVSLDTQDETTEYTMTMDMVYDYYTIEKQRVLVSIDTPVTPVTPVPIVQLDFSEDFTNLNNWALWGYPTPVIIADAGATDGFGFDSNGAGAYESGAVQNAAEIPVVNPFEFTFRVKQPLGSDSNDGYYLVFGITEGAGMSSTSNGRTGSTIMGVSIDGGSKNTNIKQITYQFKNTLDALEADYSNDGGYHQFKFVYTPGTATAVYEIYKDDVLAASETGNISKHDNLYLFIQGKSEQGIQVLDSIVGVYGEV